MSCSYAIWKTGGSLLVTNVLCIQKCTPPAGQAGGPSRPHAAWSAQGGRGREGGALGCEMGLTLRLIIIKTFIISRALPGQLKERWCAKRESAGCHHPCTGQMLLQVS